MRGDIMTTRQIASTLMGCPEPAASFESAGFAILNQPMHWQLTAGPRQRLTLTNSAGSIALERLPLGKLSTDRDQ